jgi:hypothetical protein
MGLAVIVHYSITTLAAPGSVSGNAVDIVEDDGRGRRASFALEERIDICTTVDNARICAFKSLKGCQKCRVVIFRLLQPLKGNVIRARRVISPKLPYVPRVQPIVWRLRLVKTMPKYEPPKFHTFMKATCPLPSLACRLFVNNIPFIMSLIRGSAKLSPGERSRVTFAMYWKTTSSNNYMS